MADEEVKPVEEVIAPVEEAKQEELPLAADAAEETKPVEAAPETSTEVPAEEPKTDWREKELKSKHRQLQEAKRKEAELQAEIETQRALLAKFNQGKEPEVQVVPATEIEKKAQELVAQQRYLEECNAAAKSGEKTYGDGWKSAIENLEILGGFDAATMNGVLATDDPARVLFELGKNPDNYRRIMGLSLERRILEMGRLSMQPATKQISNAPAPVTPVGGRAAPAKETLSDKLDDDQWFSIRRKQRLEKFQASHSPRR